jgi:Major Facilitator Superfamily
MTKIQIPPVPDAEKRDALGIRRVLPESGPQSTLAIATLVNTIGTGLYMGSSALYFTRIVGLSPGQVGLGLGLGALAALIVGPLAGHAADRWGPRETNIVTTGTGGAVALAFLLVETFWPFVLVACLASCVLTASQASRAPLIRSFGGDNPVRLRAYLRSVFNLGITVGAGIAGFAIQIDTMAGYIALIVGNAVSFLVSAAILTTLPHVPLVPLPGTQRRLTALTDRPYLTVTLLNGFMSLHHAIPTFALPLWIIGYTDAPRWLVSGGLLVNTLMVVAFQVRASRGVDNCRSAAQRFRWAGGALFVGIALIAGAAELQVWSAALVLVLAVVVYTLGELWQQAAAFEFSFGLAPAHAQGQYSGVFNLGQGLASAAAPALLAVICLNWGSVGWLMLGALMMVIGLVTPLAVDRASETGLPQLAAHRTALPA